MARFSNSAEQAKHFSWCFFIFAVLSFLAGIGCFCNSFFKDEEDVRVFFIIIITTAIAMVLYSSLAVKMRFEEKEHRRLRRQIVVNTVEQLPITVVIKSSGKA